MDESTNLEGTVVSIIYQNHENGYAVLRLDSESDGIITAVGCMPGIAPGEELILSGEWITHQSYGQQFRADWIERRLPVGAEAIYTYLASGAIKTIGPAKARDIVQEFGSDTLDVIENEPEKLVKIRGINEKRAMQIGQFFRKQVGLRRLMEFIANYNLKPPLAMSLYKCYGDDAIDAIRNNPYIIVGDFFGADFFEADAMAVQLGFDSDCVERVEAAVIFELAHNLTNGHCFLPYEKLISATDQLIGVGFDPIVDAMDILCESGYVVRELVAGQDACYLSEIHEAEKYVSDRILEMIADSLAKVKNAAALVSAIERDLGVKYSEKQKTAIELCAGANALILTGGPGTGKTTAVRGILSVLDMLDLNTVLCAPTGRAAKRMSELCFREAATVHRLLQAGYSHDGGSLVFERDESNPLEADAVILDEASMVDVTLMRALLSAMPRGCRLIMVGDADQLPSVGPGNVFADIIRSEAVPAVKLSEIFRQAGESQIVKNAHMINHGEHFQLSENMGDFFFLQRSSAEKTAETIVSLFCDRLPGKMGIEPWQIQILSPTRKREAGTANLNLLIQEAVNPARPDKKERAYGNFIFREGDKVMQIKNNYDIMWKSVDGVSAGTGIFNGDIGRIFEIDSVHEVIAVDFEDKLVMYSFDQLGELEPAYAMTVHKSQGSEYKAVILAAAPGAPQLLTRSVLYTAVTRAKELLIIVGDSGIVSQMITNDKRQRRYSGLRARLAGE